MRNVRPIRPARVCLGGIRSLHSDGRNRLSTFWSPAVSLKSKDSQDGGQPLVRAGIMRQAHSGVFHLLPLGLRIQDKIERLIDKHMQSLGASKVSLSSLSSEELWACSGRLEGRDSEFLRLTDRKGAKYLLSPTHEEEITTIVANAVQSYKDLPLRLYQVSRKYRDEARPRQGLLRAREFVMKDLYTFDTTEEQARATYELVRAAYRAFLDELRLPYLVAAASSGTMGGNLSHEYHFVSASGEDTVISCKSCGYAVNEEVYHPAISTNQVSDTQTTYGISKQHDRYYEIVTPAGAQVNLHAVKRAIPDLDTSVENAQALRKPGMEQAVLFDPRCVSTTSRSIIPNESILAMPQDGDRCPNCATDSLAISQAVEVGHTFHLGTRYSEPLSLRVLDASNKIVTPQMGCHGIGVSRLIATVSGLLADGKGLNWPLAIAPFRVLIVAATSALDDHVSTVYDTLVQAMDFDAVIDDRPGKNIGYKLDHADVVGYPFIVVLGRTFASEKKVELQCRRLSLKVQVPIDELPDRIAQLSADL